MGSANSQFLQQEKPTWEEHLLKYDEAVRESCLRQLKESFPVGSIVYLGFQDKEYLGNSFQHWFLMDHRKTFYLEFGNGFDIYNSRVHVSTLPHQPHEVKEERTFDEVMMERAKIIMGMSNFSLCLRNSEHVANFVFRDRWYSSQVMDDGKIVKIFSSEFAGDSKQLLNKFPSDVKPYIFSGKLDTHKIYSFLEHSYIGTDFNYFLDNKDDTYNILIIGPTGAGKSHLINIFFNQPICESAVSHKSVTKEVYFIRGEGKIYNPEMKKFEPRTIVVADTVGLCDTDRSDEEIVKLIQSRVSSNFQHIDAVFIVFKADRIPKESKDGIIKMLDWLGYRNDNAYLRFLFVGTHAEHLQEEKKKELAEQMKELLNLSETTRTSNKKDNYESLIYIGFPPEDSLNERGEEKVKESWDKLQPLLRLHHGPALQDFAEVIKTSDSSWRFPRLRVPSGGCVIL